MNLLGPAEPSTPQRDGYSAASSHHPPASSASIVLASPAAIGVTWMPVGYGGSCYPKDVKALVRTARKYETRLRVLEAVEEVNERQKLVLVPKILEHFGGNIKGKTFGIWGLSFKAKTDDMREAPSIQIIKELHKLGPN